MAEIIRGCIVKILSDTQIIINKGEGDGVVDGMAFVIYDEGEEQTDPETGKSLDFIEIHKGKLKVKQTMPKMSLLETGEKLVEKRRKSAYVEAAESIARLSQSYTTVERVKETLNLGGDAGRLREFIFSQKPVKVSDKVRSVVEN